MSAFGVSAGAPMLSVDDRLSAFVYRSGPYKITARAVGRSGPVVDTRVNHNLALVRHTQNSAIILISGKIEVVSPTGLLLAAEA